ncbi:hypothetical protein HY36_00425 [Hyphomonas atlantica]|uniref:Uncharacterized protein n=1 Tax=Hyphomonas atlantica TaxID=1280948 RepID=A0A059EBD5_9PROT|nr:hypothetical protein HY36_00425 [Hyphomonas atlantica]
MRPSLKAALLRRIGGGVWAASSFDFAQDESVLIERSC